MGIPVDRSFVEKLIIERWGSVPELAKGWTERVACGFQKCGTARDRKTIYRWLSKGLPNDRESVYGFASILGVDPVVMLDFEDAKFQKSLTVEWFFYLANAESRGKLSSLWPLVRPAVNWPAEHLATDFFDTYWATCEFEHPAEDVVNTYAQIRLCGDRIENAFASHRVYYFAYKSGGARDNLWRPYAVVRKRGPRAICVNHNGDMMQDENGIPKKVSVSDDGTLDAETFFGPGKAAFKVACLHPFTIQLTVPSRAKAALRFPG